MILKQALDFSTCHSALLSKANKISHEYAVITNANCHHSPLTRCVCGCMSVYTYVFAPRAIDIGSVNPILSTSLQQQGIIHKNNLNIYVTWHAKKGHKSSLRLSSHDGVHIKVQRVCFNLFMLWGEKGWGFPAPRFMLETQTRTCRCMYTHQHVDSLLPPCPQGGV